MSFFTSFKKLVGIIKIYEGNINERQIDLNLVSHFGLLSQTKITAYDSFNKLLAVGSDHGIIKIYGRTGIEFTLNTKISNSKLISLMFIPEQERLVIAFASKLEVWSLSSQTKEFEIVYDKKSISTIVYSYSANIVYVGFSDGDVHSINTSQEIWRKSLYKIEFSKAWIEPSKSNHSREVISILINPERDDYIAVGYALGIIEWDVAARKTLRSYVSEFELCSMCWDFKGTHILAGYRNGEISLWKHKKMTAQEMFRLSKDNEPSSVDKIITTIYNDERMVLYLGGLSHRNTFTLELGENKKRSRKFIKAFEKGNDIIDIFVTYKSTSSNSDPASIVCISNKGLINVFSISNLNIQKLTVPISHTFNHSKVVASKLVRISHSFHDDIITTSKLNYHSEEWPITGGEFNVSDPKPALLVTGNSDNNIYIWDVSLKSTMHLLTLLNIDIDKDDSITCIEMCPVSREMFIGTQKGHLYHYYFAPNEINDIMDTLSSANTEVNQEPQTETETDVTVEKEATVEKEVPTVFEDSNNPTETKNEGDTPNETTNEEVEKPMNLGDTEKDEEKLQSSPEKTDPSSQQNSHEPLSQNCDEKTKSKILYPNRFLLKQKLNIESSITSIVCESGLGYIAVGTKDGHIALYKINVDPIETVLHIKIKSPISKIMFCETQLKDCNALLLIISCADGEAFKFNLNAKELIPLQTKKNTTCIESLIVNQRGKLLQIRKRVWKWNGSNCDDENTPKNTPQFTGRETHKDEKYFIHCTVNEIAIYNIPDFEPVQKVKTPAPISWFGIMTVRLPITENPKNEESCLFGIDHSLNIHMWTLMDLREILQKKKLNMAKYGAFCVSPLDMKNSCTLRDGSFYIISDFSESFYFTLIPFRDDRPSHLLSTTDSKKINLKNKSALRGVRQFLGSKKEVDFEKLFGEVETNPKQGQTKNSNEKVVIQQSNEVSKTLSEAKEKLNERGERLSELSEKTSEMAQSSSNFAQKARQLAELQKKSSWF